VNRKLHKYVNVWPIDRNANKKPQGWQGWPDNKQFSLVLTHDVDTESGQKKCYDLIKLEEGLGYRSSFNFVPKRYNVSLELRNHLNKSGFEVVVHGLYHDGKLYKSEKIFKKRADQINQYLKNWDSKGFRSPAMHHNLDWIHALNVEYDMSTFDTDPFEPQSDGAGTIFPFLVKSRLSNKVIVEMPYTLPQDFTVFIILKESTIDIWKKKLDWIVENGGMVLLNVHPDYMNFNNRPMGVEEYTYKLYKHFLEYVKAEYEGKYWHALPKQVARYVLTILQ
jgi:hypothetical protein